jgi:hypothetical protein
VFAAHHGRYQSIHVPLTMHMSDFIEIGLQHSPPSREFRSSCMMRWIFRLIVTTVVVKLVNRYFGSRHPQPRSR